MKLLLFSTVLMLAAALVAVADEAGEGKQKNRLANEKSPYLKQHAADPVHWYAWGEEAFAAARKQNKPIFLSVGFSTCHWCHVMGRESFSNKEIAAVMNEHYINIKLDREERPDVDQVYMTFIQATTGGGGWPMNVWLTPDLKPFVGGTYFPPEDKEGRPGFKTVLGQLATAWKKDEENIRKHAGQLTAQLKEVVSGEEKPANDLPPATQLKTALEALKARYDPNYGGFGKAPKFPGASGLAFLHHQAASKQGGNGSGAKALEMSATTLGQMAKGGIYDHLGGGFHRYSVDARWRIPHYEKMLYDQAQLTVAYLEAARLSGDDSFGETARGILGYVSRRMTHPDGGFYSAEDADSYRNKDAKRKSEGAFYTWQKKELEDRLGEDAGIFHEIYGIEEQGNAPVGSDPLGKLAGTNTLYLKLTMAEAAKQSGLSEVEASRRIEAARQTLFRAREKRPRPHRDEKIITAWNGLMISAYAKAHQQLGDAEYLKAATRSANFLRDHLYDEKRGVLIRSYLEAPAAIDGFAADYACLIQGLLDLYEAGFDHRWLEWADALQAKQDELFHDESAGGYFSSSGKDESVLLRTRKFYDDSEPSENSLAAMNLQRLGAMLAKPDYVERARLIIRAYGSQPGLKPDSCPLMLIALDRIRSKPTQVVIAGKPGAPDTKALIELVRRSGRSNRVVLLADGADGQAFLGKHADFYTSLVLKDQKATAYVCEDFVCQLPTTDPAQLEKLLATEK